MGWRVESPGGPVVIGPVHGELGDLYIYIIFLIR